MAIWRHTRTTYQKYQKVPVRIIPNSGVSSLNVLCLNLTPCPLSFKGEGDMGVRSLKMKLQAFQLLILIAVIYALFGWRPARKGRPPVRRARPPQAGGRAQNPSFGLGYLLAQIGIR